jgi:gliding motility-associated-like protein
MKKNFTLKGSDNYKGSKTLPIILAILFTIISPSVFGGVVSGTFTSLASCPMNLTCFTVDPTTGYFYGQGDQGSTNYYRYNAGTNTWTTLASSPQPSGNNGGATYLNGKIYNSYCSYNVITVYTIATNSWTTISGGLNSGSISNDGTDIYVSADGTFKKYVISSGTWVTLSATSCQPWGGLQYKNGFFYLHVGNGQSGFKRYEVATDTWTTLTNVPGGAVLGSAIYDAYYYCQGSYGGTNLYSYDLGAGEWNNTLTLPFTTDDAAIVTYGTSLYIVQGEAGTGFTKFTPNNPMLTNIEGSSLAYNIGDPAAIITSTITASQNTGVNFQSAIVTISANYQSGKDVLSYVNANGITGSWNSSTGELTLTGTTTIANYQTALRTVKYSNTDVTSTNGTRTVSFKVYDGSQYSNTAKRNIYFPGVPILTSTTAISSITTTTASSGGFVSEDGGSTVTARGVCWSTTSGPLVTDSKTTDGSGLGSFTSSMTGLTSGATYYVRAYATNSTGTGYGNERTFTTIGPSITVSTASLSGFTACIGGAASSPLSFTVSGAYLSANIVITAPTQYEVSTSSGSGYGASVTLAPSGGTVSNTTIYTRLLTTSSGTVTGNISITSTSATSKSVALSGTVSPLAVGGSISGSSPVTYGSASGTMTLSGYSGLIKRWEKKLESGSWTTIVNTATTYSETPSAAGTWYYRAVISSGSCSDVYSAEFSLTVNTKALTVTGASVTSKVYTGTTAATITGSSLSGIVGSDVVALANNTTGTFALPDYGSGISVTTSMTLTGANASNYTLTQPILTGSITKAPLTVTAVNKNRNYGAADPAFTVSYTGFVNSETSGVLDVVPTASSSASATSNVGTYTITPAGGSDNNYSFSYVNGTLTINKAPLTVTPNNQTRPYGDVNPSLTINYSGFANGETESVIDTKPVASTTATLTSSVGNYTISASGGTDNNYSLSFVNGTLEVTKADLAATADDKVKTYGQTNPSLTVSFNGFKNSETSSVLDALPVASTTATTTSNTGTYTISLSSVTDNNYNVVRNNGTLTVNRAPLTVTAVNKSRLFGAANPVFTLSYSGFVNSETSAVLDAIPTATTSADASSNVGTYSIIPSGGSDNNYSYSYVNGTLTIDKAQLTVTADDQTRHYGDANPTLTLSYSGFVNDDTESVIDVNPVASTTADLTSDVGDYTITAAGGSDNNYSFSFVNGTLDVTKTELIATADDNAKTYGQSNPSLTVSFSGFKNGENQSVLDEIPVASTLATAASGTGLYTISLSSVSDNNYSVTCKNGTLTIEKATLIVTADGQTKVYGSANPLLTFSYTGFQNSDDKSQLDVEPSASTTISEISLVGTYNNSITLTGGSDDNYAFTYVPAYFDVTKAILTVTAHDKSRVYGESNPSLTEHFSGFVNGDNEAMIDVNPIPATTALMSSNAGAYPIIATGGSDNNYDFIYIAGTLTVTKASLSVTADNKSKTYGEVNPALTFVYSGFVLDDDQTQLDVDPVISTTALTTSDAGSYGIVLSGGSDNNYSFAFTNGTLTVNKAALNAKADNKSKTYGDQNPVLTISYEGFVNGDNASKITEPSVNTAALTGSSAGTYPIVLTDNTTKNYTLTLTNGVLTVNKATLSVTAENKSKQYGDAVPALTVLYQGFVGTDNKSVLDTEPSISTTALSISSPGAYNITVEGGSDNNYLFTYSGATLTISKKNLTFTADSKNRDYLSVNPSLTYTISGFVNNETITVLDELPSISTEAVQNSNAGNYGITLSGGNDNCYNYLFNNGVLSVAKIPQVITFSDVPAKILEKEVYTLVAISTSGLPVSFESMNTGSASVSIDQLTGLARGMAQVRAYNDGNVNYLPAEIFAEVEISTTHKDILHLFTPNNDGYNDTWEIPDISSYGICDVRIFNRWGKLVYANKNYDNLWDGTSNGAVLPDGAYYFIIKTQNSGTISGTVNIVR